MYISGLKHQLVHIFSGSHLISCFCLGYGNIRLLDFCLLILDFKWLSLERWEMQMRWKTFTIEPYEMRYQLRRLNARGSPFSAGGKGKAIGSPRRAKRKT